MGLKPEDRDKTTFVCKNPDGRTEYYRFKVACLELAGCPSAYQTWMENVMKDCRGTQVYLDDMIHAWNQGFGVSCGAVKKSVSNMM